MGKFSLQDSDIAERIIVDSIEEKIIKKESYEKFNEKTLGLGDMTFKSRPAHSLAAIFDLEGFTNFCKQPDSHLVAPDFIASFLKWIYSKIRAGTIKTEKERGYILWSELPFFSKFLGDGIMFIWNTERMDNDEICNVIILLKEICEEYEDEFLPSTIEDYSSLPNKLRCGIARGVVYNIGNDNDFIGPCINMAARLQKTGSFSFSFSRRGVNYAKHMHESCSPDFITVSTEVRGIGTELICVLKREYEALSIEDAKLFTKVVNTATTS